MIRRMLPDDESCPTPRPFPLQCAMAHGRTGEAAGEDRTRDNRRPSKNVRDDRTRNSSRANDDGRDLTRDSGRSGGWLP